MADHRTGLVGVIVRVIAAGILLLGSAAAEQDSAASPILFALKGADGSSGYLLGTMHSDEPRVLSIVDALGPELGQVRRLVLEMVPDAVALLATAGAMVYTDGTSLRQRIPPELFESVRRIYRQRGLPELLLEYAKPWAVALTLNLPQTRDDVLDLRLYKEAIGRRLPVFGLETAQEQLAVFEELTERDQLQMLEFAVRDADKADALFRELVDAYVKGDLGQLEALVAEQEGAWGPELEQWFRQRMIDKRNRLMVERMKAHLQQGPALVAVGALHLPGETGIVRLLRDDGYTVVPLSR